MLNQNETKRESQLETLAELHGLCDDAIEAASAIQDSIDNLTQDLEDSENDTSYCETLPLSASLELNGLENLGIAYRDIEEKLAQG